MPFVAVLCVCLAGCGRASESKPYEPPPSVSPSGSVSGSHSEPSVSDSQSTVDSPIIDLSKRESYYVYVGGKRTLFGGDLTDLTITLGKSDILPPHGLVMGSTTPAEAIALFGKPNNALWPGQPQPDYLAPNAILIYQAPAAFEYYYLTELRFDGGKLEQVTLALRAWDNWDPGWPDDDS